MQIPQQKLIIKQVIEPVEIFTEFETANKYEVLDENKSILYYAYEESNFLLKQIFGTRRPLQIKIIDKDKKTQLVLEKPFYFLRANYTVRDSEGKIIAYIKQKRWFMHHISFDVYDYNNQLLFICSAKLPHPWTFNVLIHQENAARILKKWSGIGRETFTDADTFLIEFDRITDLNLKQILLATAFAIDLRVFERKK